MTCLKRLLAAALLVASAHGASATILAIGGEDINTVRQGTVSIITTAGRFNSTYARNALALVNNPATGVPQGNRLDVNFSAASSDFWGSIQYYSVTSGGTTLNSNWIAFTDGGITRLMLRGSGVAQQIKISTRNAAGTVVDLATATGSLCSANNRCKLDIHVVYAVAGSVDVYNNGVLIATYTGDTTTDGATTLGQMQVANHTSNNEVDASEIIVADIDTRTLQLQSCVPQAAGTPQDWSGGLVGNINEITISDATFNSTTTASQVSNWTSCTLPAGVQAVVNVHTCARMSRGGGGGPQNFRHEVRVSGVNHDSGADIMPATSFGNDCHNWGGNAPGGGAWTPATFPENMGVQSRP